MSEPRSKKYVGERGRWCRKCDADEWGMFPDGRSFFCWPCTKATVARRRRRRHRKDPRVQMLKGARLRARKAGLDFTITIDDLVIGARCPVLNIPLKVSSGRAPAPGSPSLDRLDPRRGYTPDNVRVISHRANQVKNNGTAQEHTLIAAWMRKEMKT